MKSIQLVTQEVVSVEVINKLLVDHNRKEIADDAKEVNKSIIRWESVFHCILEDRADS